MLRSNDELRSINNGLIQDNIIRISQATRKSYIEMYSGNVADLSYPTSKLRRGRVQGDGGDICPTITSSASGIHKIDRLEINEDMTREEMTKRYKIRKLTEKECFRLMGVKDADYERIIPVTSKSARYKLAGNSIVTTCLMGLFSQLNIQDIPSWNECIEKREKRNA